MLGVFSIALGATGMARKVVGFVPSAIKSGIIVGAGLSAVTAVFQVGGKFDSFPWTISIAIGIAFYLIFSQHFAQLKLRNRFWWNFAKLGILPIILLSSVVGAIIGSIWLYSRGRDRATPIPFGPYLAIAGWIVFMWGEPLIEAYLRMSGLR